MSAILHCDFTREAPAENLAADEALLDHCEDAGGGGVLRFWEPARNFVVVGYANRVATEVDPGFCRSAGLPILRRCSGGGTVVQGPGCLNYALILPISHSPQLESVSSTNQFIMSRIGAAITPLVGTPVEIKGHTDLALGGIKFAGNAQRRRRRCLLFHGVLLLDFDLALIEQSLPMPSHQPDYRANRPHRDFVRNLGLPSAVVKSALRQAWGAQESLVALPEDRIESLTRERYSTDAWNSRF
jgi:lipoate-protein ligase A